MASLVVIYQKDTLHILGVVLRQTKPDPEPAVKDIVGADPSDGVTVRHNGLTGTIPAERLAVHVFDTDDLTVDKIKTATAVPGTCTVEVDSGGKVTGIKVLASRATVSGGPSFTVKVGGVNNTLPLYALVQHTTGASLEPDTSNPAHFSVASVATGDLVYVLVQDQIPVFAG